HSGTVIPRLSRGIQYYDARSKRQLVRVGCFESFRPGREDTFANGSPRDALFGAPITREKRSDRSPLVSEQSAPGKRALIVGEHVLPPRPTGVPRNRS